MIKALDDDHDKEEQWTCAHNPLCRIKAKPWRRSRPPALPQRLMATGAGCSDAVAETDPETQLWHSLDEDANAKVEAIDRRAARGNC